MESESEKRRLMEIKIDSKVIHKPTGTIITVNKINRKTLEGTKPGKKFDWITENTKVNIDDCEPYIEPVKEKSFYEILRERNMEDDDSLQSSLIEQDYNCFIIELWDKTANTWNGDMKVLYHVEPKISNLIEDVSSQLGQYGLEVYTADFGSTDA